MISWHTLKNYTKDWYGTCKNMIENTVYPTRYSIFGSNDVFCYAEHVCMITQKTQMRHLCSVIWQSQIKKDTTKMDRVMGFGHPSRIKLRNEKHEVFIDAICACTLKWFYQTLIVMVQYHDTQHYVPVCWFIVTSKSKRLVYHALFQLSAIYQIAS